MISLSLRFPSGRFHATPWGRHVNEGAPEWPPSPWRILRALVAVWKRTLPDLPAEEVGPALRALADAPVFGLPSASTGHTRHYMPWYKKGPDDRTLVFDAFVALPRDAEVRVLWPDAELAPAQARALACIAANLNTLGRSESWCQATLSTAQDTRRSGVEAELRCLPLASGGVPDGHEVIRLLCPDPERAFDEDAVVKVTEKTTGRGKSKRTVLERSTVCDPAWNLCMETLQLHKERWSDPPGSRWVSYARPQECFQPKRAPARPPARVRERVHAVRYALDSTVLPLVTNTLSVAEAARRHLMGIFKNDALRRGFGGNVPDPLPEGVPLPKSPVFSGKDADGVHLLGHGHAYCLPSDEDGDSRLDHLTVFAREGFGPDELRALDGLRGMTTGRKGEESHPLRLLLVAMAAAEEMRSGPLGHSRAWVSATPYLATRYAKTRGRDRVDIRSAEARAEFLAADLRAQLQAVLPDANPGHADIQPIVDPNGVFKVAGRWRPIQFQRYRRKKNDDGGRRIAGAFRIVFPNLVQGPVCLGHSAHFGMGLFLPDEEGDWI